MLSSNAKARYPRPFALRFLKLFPLCFLPSPRSNPPAMRRTRPGAFQTIFSAASNPVRSPKERRFAFRFPSAQKFPQRTFLTGRKIPSEVISRRYRLNSFGAIKDAPYDSFACRLAAAAVNLKIFKSARRKKYCRLRAGKRRIPFPRLFNGASFRLPLNVSPSQADVLFKPRRRLKRFADFGALRENGVEADFSRPKATPARKRARHTDTGSGRSLTIFLKNPTAFPAFSSRYRLYYITPCIKKQGGGEALSVPPRRFMQDFVGFDSPVQILPSLSAILFCRFRQSLRKNFCSAHKRRQGRKTKNRKPNV